MELGYIFGAVLLLEIENNIDVQYGATPTDAMR